MNTREELRRFTNQAHEISLNMIVVVDQINLGTLSHQQGAEKLDRMARDMSVIQSTIKDFAYALKRGDENVSFAPLAVRRAIEESDI